MKRSIIMLLSAMLLLAPIASAKKPPSILSDLSAKLEAEYLLEFGSPFDPAMTALPMVMEYEQVEYQYAVNENFLRLFNALMDTTELIPLYDPPPSFFETTEFGIIIGVVGTALIVFLAGQL